MGIILQSLIVPGACEVTTSRLGWTQRLDLCMKSLFCLLYGHKYSKLTSSKGLYILRTVGLSKLHFLLGTPLKGEPVLGITQLLPRDRYAC